MRENTWYMNSTHIHVAVATFSTLSPGMVHGIQPTSTSLLRHSQRCLLVWYMVFNLHPHRCCDILSAISARVRGTQVVLRHAQIDWSTAMRLQRLAIPVLALLNGSELESAIASKRSHTESACSNEKMYSYDQIKNRASNRRTIFAHLARQKSTII